MRVLLLSESQLPIRLRPKAGVSYGLIMIAMVPGSTS